MCTLVAATVLAIIARTQTINKLMILQTQEDVRVDNAITNPIIQCNNNTNCYIDCSLSNRCEYATIYCTAAEYSCSIKCAGYRNCYNTVIISYSYNFSLICDPDASKQTCYNLSANISYTEPHQSKSVVHIENCAYSSFYMANIDDININCDDQRGCGNTTFVISDSNTVNIDCNSYFSCFGAHIHIANTVNTNLVCNYSKSCYNAHADSRNNGAQMNLICVNDGSCSNIYLSCNTKQFQACYIDCFTADSCSNIYMPVYTNDYVQDFLYFNPNAPIWNRYDSIYMQCYSPISNDIIHTTYISVTNNGSYNSYSCSDNICCPLKPHNLRNVICAENSQCTVKCVANSIYTGCNLIDASKARSLNLTCENCIASTIICPNNYHSTCTVSCISDSISLSSNGCIYSLINANNRIVNLQCQTASSQNPSDSPCINTILYTATNLQYISIRCIGGFACSDLNTNLINAHHISLECNDCSGLNISVPKISQSTEIVCISYKSCSGMIINVDASYEYQFMNIDCLKKNTNCGTISLQCQNNINQADSIHAQVYAYNPNTKCSNYLCCPFTHKDIYCNNNNHESYCSLNCSGNSGYPNTTFCGGQFIYGANQINCYGQNACASTTIFCPKDRCSVTCNYINTKYRTCNHAIIIANSVEILDINCMYYGCGNMQINANGAQHAFLNCFGDDSCEYSHINVSNANNVTIFSQPNFTRTDTYNDIYSLRSAKIIATNVTNLEMTCISGINGVQYGSEQIACYNTYVYIGNNTRLQCNGTACKNMQIYSNKATLTNQQLNVFINDCELCGRALCINKWRMQCDSYRSSTFDGTCSNYYCCHKNIFTIDNDYNVCAPEEWQDFDNDLLYYFGLIIGGIISFGFVVMIFEFIYHIYVVRKHKRCQLPFKPPLFILRYVHIIDFAISLTFIYIVFCFAKTRNHVLSYCSSKYSPYDVPILCDEDIHCSSNGFVACYVSSVLNGLSITYYVFFGIYFALTGAYLWWIFYSFETEKNIAYDSTTWTLRIFHCVSANYKNLWKTRVVRDYVAIRHFKGIRNYWRYWLFFILFAISIFANFFTELYVLFQWFVLYPILFSMIISECLKAYYRGLPPFDEVSIIKSIIINKFGYDIGDILFQYLDLYSSRHTFVDAKQQSLLVSHKFSINN
eukprot:278606_1